MESRNLGLIRALAWERTPAGVEFRCVTELLAAARVAVEVAGPRAVRVRITAGAVPRRPRRSPTSRVGRTRAAVDGGDAGGAGHRADRGTSRSRRPSTPGSSRSGTPTAGS